MLLHIQEVEVVGDHLLRLRFSNDTGKVVDVRPLLEGPMFSSLLERENFAQASLDPTAKVVTWPNGADLAPEALYQLPAVAQAAH